MAWSIAVSTFGVKILADALDAHVYQLPDAPPPPKLPPPPENPPLSLELLPPLLQPPPEDNPPDQPPLPPGAGAVMLSLNIVNADATIAASAETISDPKMNHATSPI